MGQDAAPAAAAASTRTRRHAEYYVQEDYLAPRVRNTSRRYRGNSPTLEPLKEAETEEEEEEEKEEEEEDRLSSDSDSDKGNCDRNHVGVSDDVMMRSALLHSPRLSSVEGEQRSSCSDDVEVGVVSDREDERLEHRTPSQEELGEEEVQLDDSRGESSLVVDNNPSSPPTSSLNSDGCSSAQPSGCGYKEESAVGKGTGAMGYLSWGDGRNEGARNFPLGYDNFYRPGVLGTAPNWGLPDPYLMRGVAPIQNPSHFMAPIQNSHFMAPIQNSHLIGGMAPRQGHAHHLIRGVAPNLGPPITPPLWSMAPAQNPSPHLLHGGVLPVPSPSKTGTKDGNEPDHHQLNHPAMKYMF